MSYRRPSEMPAPEVLVPQFEAAIKSLVRRFRNHPYAFYTETDMHCYLYHRLYAGGLVNGLYRTADGHVTILLHKEYPTVARYRRGDDGRLEESAQGRRRGAFDISIWDNLKDAASRVRVVFVHVDADSKPKPRYLGDWGTV